MEGSRGISVAGHCLNSKSILALAFCLTASACGTALEPTKISVGDLLKAQNGIIGYWGFEETVPGLIPGGYDFADLSGLNHHGKILGNLQIGTTGYSGHGITSTGLGSVMIPLDLSNEKIVTLSVFVNPHISTFNMHNVLWEYTTDSTTSNGFFAGLDDNANSPIHSFVTWMHGAAGTLSRSSPTLSSTWHHVVIRYDQSVASQNTITLNVDGADVSTTIYSSQNAMNSGTFANSALFLLCRAGNQFCLKADLDELIIWNRAVSASEMHAIYPF